MSNRLYHLISAPDWAKWAHQPTYSPDSLAAEGFIHLSRKEQVAGVVKRYYPNVPDMLVLHIDAARLTSELRYEPATHQELFPHVYGPINADAIVAIEPLTSTAFGL